MPLLALLALGFLLGMRHATDSDHVIAVTTIVSRERTPRAALRIGVLWGLGHTATLLAVGGAILVFGWVIPPRLGLTLELAVAVVLIALGVMNLTGAFKRVNRIAHRHDVGAAAHTHADAAMTGSVRPLAVGLAHGLAGSAAAALLVLATRTSAGMAMVYLTVFGFGTVAGMVLLTLLMSVPISVLSGRFSNIERLTAHVMGVVSIAFGIFLAYRIGIADGLLFGTPNWTPR